MGIRFLCPNGHKLHVKAHLAGRKGVCPTCGAKIVIPLESVVAAAAPAATAPEPAAEAPAAAGWFVRGADGEQYGPAPEELFESWIAEGRIAADTWVWREGWPEWRQASDALPGKVAPPMPPAPPARQPPPDPEPGPFESVVTRQSAWPAASPAYEFDDESPAVGFAIDVERADSIARLRKTHTRRRLKSSTVWAVTVLSLLAVALCALLIWILAFGS